MSRELEIMIRPESSILARYKESDYKIQGVLSEFIDNSTQSYFDNRSELNCIGIDKCKIEIEIFPDYIRITDNAYGMNEKNFRRALKLDSPPEDTSGRNEKGMGLKTAATYLGSLWKVTTTELGSTELYVGEMDVDLIQSEAPEKITASALDCDKNDHYTIIEIKKLNQKITPQKLRKVSDTIAEMYSRDIKNGDALIIINKSPLKYEMPALRKKDDGTEYMKTINTTLAYEGVEYTFSGWAGIREKGSTSGSGLTLLHKGRAVVTNYRPKSLLGNSNSFSYQRIIGEIDMGDEWPISHTKDAFLWDGGLEDKFIETLKKKDVDGIGDLISISQSLRKDDVTKEEKKKIIKKTEKQLSQLQNTAVGSEELNEQIKEQPKQVDYTPKPTSRPNERVITIPFQGCDYKFEIREQKSIDNKWIEIQKTSEKDLYLLCIDFDLPYFHDVLNMAGDINNKNYAFIEKMAVSIALSYLTSQNSGCRDGHMVINMLNAIISAAR